ncbi:hypothetical protein EYC80_004079 [Monilinia laxa]|uniref:Uncharacterized protein n=1 Tax=Monilinia laxa TaxID=61186 RepID=A0A5N6KLL7_MONLA|nr:hypothetical protein EYC80_004079 [Monilinia laxa]
MVQSITSKSTKTSGTYDILEDDDYEEHEVERAQISSSLPSSSERKNVTSREGSSPKKPLVLSIPRPRPRQTTATASSNNTTSPLSPCAIFPGERAPIFRTASGHSISLRHPTPDLQTLQGAYVGNIDKLERSAERLSMTSSIEDAIRELHMEQKRSESRRSSMRSQLNEMPQVSRSISNSSSIIDVNNAARSGGYSPAGYMMSPKGSFSTTTTGRPASKGSRFGSRQEPELEGRPLESIVDHRTPSIAEQDERSATLTRQVVDNPATENPAEHIPEQADDYRPQTSTSTNTYDQAERMFADFDGVHSAPLRTSFDRDSIMGEQGRVTSGMTDWEDHNDQRSSSGTQIFANDNSQRRVPSDNQQSMARPQSYADPNTGQQMVYYPARVPMMLNLPQKLSKNPSSMARNKRRSQVLSNIPAAARQSAIWLPDVLENNGEPLPEDHEAQNLEYIPQHQRMSMGGRRNTQDLEHMPAHLRANLFFDLPPGQSEAVELKEQSAVATLDSILDASAHAPVTAFVDHAIAGPLGSEVYGKPHKRNKSSTHLLAPDKQDGSKKRTSSFNFLLGRRASNNNLLGNGDKRASSMTNLQVERKATRSPIEDDEDDINNKDTTPLRHSRAVSGATDLIRAEEGEVESEEDEGQRDDEIFHGPPTTLLAELQLRKQQQKIRTRPPVSVNGMQSTLLQMDTVLQRQQENRRQKRINLAWQINNEDPEAEDDEDVPLAMLNVTRAYVQEVQRPLGLMEKRALEDNEPLSRRRARLTGQPMPMPRATTMTHVPTAAPDVEEEEGETLAQRIRRLKEKGGTATGLPATRPVSGDFASEIMSQFGGGLTGDKGKGKEKETSTTPVNEEEETLGQRRKRLQAEREAREKEVGTAGDADAIPQPLVINKMNSMADILSAHPAAGASRSASFTKPSRPATGLLGLHEQQTQQRANTITNLVTQQNLAPRGSRVKSGTYNDPHSQGQPGMMRPHTANYNLHNALPNSGYPQFAQPTSMNSNNLNKPLMPYGNAYQNTGYQNTMPMGGYNNIMPMQMQMQMQMQNIHTNPVTGMPTGPDGEPLNQGQADMVERWRQSVMH